MPWLSGRFWGRSPLQDPATEPSKAQEGAVSEATFGSYVVANANILRIPQRLPQVNSPKAPPTGPTLLPGGVALGAHFDS